MHTYWRSRALEADRRLTHTGRAIKRAHSLVGRERSLLIATVRGLGGYDEFQDSENESDSDRVREWAVVATGASVMASAAAEAA